jgi:heme A synthase
VNPVFQLVGKTWPVTVAAVIALATDLCLLAFTDANASVDSLARAYSLSLVVAALVSTAVAFRRPEMRPNLRDLAIVVAAVVVMVAAVRPFNALSSHVVAAVAAVLVGGAIYGAALLAFDVAGLRKMFVAKLRSYRERLRAAT